jgi:cysteine-rich repeat protein
MRFELLQGNGGARGGIAVLAMAIAAVMVSGCRLESKSTLCPTGVYCPPGAKCAAAQAVCIWDDCGDGIQQPGEACDDGNLIDGDGCSHDCKSNETCGNTITDSAVGEQCDDGNTANGDGCSSDCKSEKCGNHVVDAGEDCDDAGETARCNANCTFARRGDGIVNAHAGEQCDFGVPALDGTVTDCEGPAKPDLNLGACNWNCTWSIHGDGIVNFQDGELCDGGVLGSPNWNSCESATCNDSCTPVRCGDTIVNKSAGEECDDGNLSDQDDCISCKNARCGDGFVDSLGKLYESCDLGSFNGSTDCYYGMTSCDGCAIGCQSTLTTHAHYCGNYAVEKDVRDAGGVLHSEDCDNAISFACGTCSIPECKDVAAAAATGEIDVTSTAVTGGTSITLGDGTNAVNIELVATGGVCQTTASACVSIAATDDTPEKIAVKIEQAIAGLHTQNLINITASISSTSSRAVTLTNGSRGIVGNVPIVLTPTGAAITVAGMGDGAGCPTGAPCRLDSDCASNKCSGGTQRVCSP